MRERSKAPGPLTFQELAHFLVDYSDDVRTNARSDEGNGALQPTARRCDDWLTTHLRITPAQRSSRRRSDLRFLSVEQFGTILAMQPFNRSSLERAKK